MKVDEVEKICEPSDLATGPRRTCCMFCVALSTNVMARRPLSHEPCFFCDLFCSRVVAGCCSRVLVNDPRRSATFLGVLLSTSTSVWSQIPRHFFVCLTSGEGEAVRPSPCSCFRTPSIRHRPRPAPPPSHHNHEHSAIVRRR